jgi:hypothetical protein
MKECRVCQFKIVNLFKGSFVARLLFVTKYSPMTHTAIRFVGNPFTSRIPRS